MGGEHVLTSLMQRRRALIGNAEKIFVSGKGLPYKRSMEVALTMSGFYGTYGDVPELKEITFRPAYWGYDLSGYVLSNAANGRTKEFFKSAPNLESIKIKPVTCKNNDFIIGHYAFSWIPASVQYVEIGSLESEGVRFNNGGYFRNNNSELDPPWTQGIVLGNTNGLTLVVYRNAYSSTGGFYSPIGLLSTTTIIVRDSVSGEILTG